MRFLRRIAGFLGLGSHNDDHHDHNNNNNTNNSNSNSMNVDPIPAGPRRGFSVPVQLPLDRPAVAPILVPCNANAGLQGLRWYAKRLKTDEDGDVADEFLDEVSQDITSAPQDHANPFPGLQVKKNIALAIIKHQILTPDGKLLHRVERQGKLQWV